MQRLLTVSKLNEYIKGVIEDELVLSDISVVGEVSNFKRAGRSLFFSLCEGDYTVSCVCFNQNPKVEMRDGLSIVAAGTPEYYPKSGKLTFLVRDYTQKDEGENARKLKALKEKLEAEGLFSRKKAFPDRIFTIAVVTSSSGAVIHDIINVASRRDPAVNILICDARVQGGNAAEGIAHAIALAGKSGADALIIARGGGSQEDLSVFNSEVVARAAASCRLFSVSAVGHETDTTLCDLAADLRAPTPSAAAELLTVDIQARKGMLRYALGRLDSRFDSFLSGKKNLFSRCAFNLFSDSGRLTASMESKLDRACRRLFLAADGKISAKRSAVTENLRKICSCADRLIERKEREYLVLSGALKLSEPAKILKSGYAKVFYSDRAVTSVRSVKAGDKICIEMRDGSISAGIESIKEEKQS